LGVGVDGDGDFGALLARVLNGDAGGVGFDDGADDAVLLIDFVGLAGLSALFCLTGLGDARAKS